jgi:large subunit ribosomal protein L4e
MKVQILNSQGAKKAEIETKLFNADIRKDIIQKVAEAEKINDMALQPYAPYLWAGMETSASGNVKHNRHVWKTDRGRGVSRYPKKRMSDKGSQFTWIAAVVPGVRKGRRAHPPKVLKRELRINHKERILAILSALALISDSSEVKRKYSSLKDKKIEIKFPLVFSRDICELKTKNFFSLLEKILGEEVFNIAIKTKEIRAGKGKKRNRRYKENSGVLLITGNKEGIKISGIEIKKAKDLRVMDLALNGARLCCFTEEAVKDLEERFLKLNREASKKK